MSQAVTAEAVTADRGDGVLDRISDIFFARPKLLTFLLLLPPLLWIGIVYVGSLFALLLVSVAIVQARTLRSPPHRPVGTSGVVG